MSLVDDPTPVLAFPTHQNHARLSATRPARQIVQRRHSAVAIRVMASKVESLPRKAMPHPDSDNTNMRHSEARDILNAALGKPVNDLKSQASSVCSDVTSDTLETTDSLVDQHQPIDIPRRPAPSHRQALDMALNDTPLISPSSTAPTSPNIQPKHLKPVRQNSGDKIRIPSTTLNVPGLTKSKVSPDGRIAQRDIGAKLVIVMVGLPARGKSYITKKVCRYLNWLQHDTKIFNVGERRRVAAGGPRPAPKPTSAPTSNPQPDHRRSESLTRAARKMLATTSSIVDRTMSPEVNATVVPEERSRVPELHLPGPTRNPIVDVNQASTGDEGSMDQSAAFFDPSNKKGALIREQCAIDTLDDLLDYILVQGGSVGILDATNSTLARRKMVIQHVRERAGPTLNILFMESFTEDEELLERNMRLKLSGPDYKDKDPEKSLADFKKRVAMYEMNYTPIGDYEEKNNIPYVKMIDVGRKVISHQIRGFLSLQAVEYLMNFNLAPRQIWLTRHGQSEDNVSGKIGGDSSLTEGGTKYAKALTNFIEKQRRLWEIRELNKEKEFHDDSFNGARTPPNPHYVPGSYDDDIVQKAFCVWTSMLKRSVQTAQFFDEDEYNVKQLRMLDELSAGHMEGLTFEQIKNKYPEDFKARQTDKLHYRYPGPGGEGYLDVINRMRQVIVEIERMTDHVLLIAHRSVARVLLSYFMGLPPDKVTDLDVPMGTLYCLEPKPYGVDFRAYHYVPERDTFELEPNYELRKTNGGTAYIEEYKAL